MGAHLSPQYCVCDRCSVHEVGWKYNNKIGTYQHGQLMFQQHNLQSGVETLHVCSMLLGGGRHEWNGSGASCVDRVFPSPSLPGRPLPLTSKLTCMRPQVLLVLRCKGAWWSPVALAAIAVLRNLTTMVSSLLTDVCVPPHPLSRNQILPGLLSLRDREFL